MERKLAAIFSTDVKGYSRLMGDDEETTIHTLKTCREVITRFIEQHHGRVVDSPGDNMLAEFASAVEGRDNLWNAILLSGVGLVGINSFIPVNLTEDKAARRLVFSRLSTRGFKRARKTGPTHPLTGRCGLPACGGHCCQDLVGA